MKPHNVRQSDLTPEWHVVDARGKTLGRVSTEIATLLQGKHKPSYTPHLASGDFVVVVNADKFRVSGNKLVAKMYYRHSGYHGGLTEETLGDVLAKNPTRALKKAVKGMLPKNKQGRHMLSRLKLYVDEEHPHEAQVNAGKGAAKPTKPKTKKIKKPVAEASKAADAIAEEPAAEVPETTGEAAEPEPEPEVETAAAPEAPVAEESGGDLSALTVVRLKEMAKERGVKVPSKARKADIIEVLESTQSD